MYKSLEYGKIKFKLDKLIKEKNLTRNKLSVLSHVRNDTIKKMIDGDMTRIDLDVVCRLCKTLECSIDDLIEYEK